MTARTEAELNEMEQEVRELDGQSPEPQDPPIMPKADSRDPLEILLAREGFGEELGQLEVTGSLN